jgi:hypothetical protein
VINKNSAGSAQKGYLLEMLVADLLSELGFTHVRFAGQKDTGVDLLAKYPSVGPTGEIIQEQWAVQIKHKRSRISVQEIAKLAGLFQLKGASKALIITSSNLTTSAKEYVSKFASQMSGGLEIWDRDRLDILLSRSSDLQNKYAELLSEFPASTTRSSNSKYEELLSTLTNIQMGEKGWREYEVVCLTILKELFVPPLKNPKEQARTLSGLERRDTLFPLRGTKDGWNDLRDEFDANFLLCEFKNYSGLFGKDEVNQTRNYLKRTIGRIGIIFSRNGPDEGAMKMRNSVFAEEKKVILFFQDRHLEEFLQLKAANQNPLDLLQDAIDEFYISYE